MTTARVLPALLAAACLLTAAVRTASAEATKLGPGSPKGLEQPTAPAGNPQGLRLLDVGKLTRRQFDALPEGQALLWQGRSTTKRALLAEIEQRHRLFLTRKLDTSVTLAAPGDPVAEQRERIAQQNALASARFAEFSAAFAAIRGEALELEKLYQGASPAERARLDQRAEELNRRLEQLQGK